MNGLRNSINCIGKDLFHFWFPTGFTQGECVNFREMVRAGETRLKTFARKVTNN